MTDDGLAGHAHAHTWKTAAGERRYTCTWCPMDALDVIAAQAAEIARLVTALKWCMAKMDRGDGVLEYTGDEADVAFEATLQDLLARAALREEGKP